MSRLGPHISALHLAPSPTAAGHLRALVADLGRRDEVIEFDDGLQLGPLSDVDDGGALRAEWWSRLAAGMPGHEPPPSFDDSDRWQRIAEDGRPVVLWHGPDPAEYLFTLRACERLRVRPSRLHEVRLRAVPGGRPLLPSFYRSVALRGGDLNAAWPTHARVAGVSARAAHWRAIRARSGDWVRQLRGESIRHLPVTAFDARIVSTAGDGGRRSVSVIGLLLTDFPLNHTFLAWRIRALLGSGRLAGRGPLGRFGLPEQVCDARAAAADAL